MSPGFSFYLNLLRFLAAIVVLLSHFAYERFTRGHYLFIREWNLGSDAVVVFFVISGFVIAFAANERDKAAAPYIFARATRLFSVVIPAVILTLVLDALGSRLDPAGYDGRWWNQAPAWEVLVRTLSFTTEWTGSGFRPGTNGPFWSLSYEAAYYVLFGLALYLSGWIRAFALLLFLCAVGIKPLLLMPSWLLGVWLYYRGAGAFKTSTAAVTVLVGFGPVYWAAVMFNVPGALLALSMAAFGPDLINGLRFSNEFAWNALLGLLVAGHLAGAMKLLGAFVPRQSWARGVSWLAGASFSLYLVHYPLLQFWHAVLPAYDGGLLRDGVLLSCTVVSCFVFASLFERRLGALRKGLRHFSSGRRGVVPVES